MKKKGVYKTNMCYLSEKDEKSTSEKIKEAAFLYFLEQGYEATNLRDISQVAGIKAASIYFYFKSKKELFLTIYEEILTSQLLELEKIVQKQTSKNPLDTLHNIYKWNVFYCQKKFVESRFVFRFRLFPAKEIMPEAGILYQKSRAKEYEILLPYLEELQKEKEDKKRGSKVLYNFLKRQDNYIQSEMLISSVALSEEEIEMNWERFLSDI